MRYVPPRIDHHQSRSSGAAGLILLLAVVLAIAGYLCYRFMVAQATGRPAERLVLFCAAGLKPPVDEVVAAYQRELGVEVQVQYGGSGTLLGSLQLSKSADLYLAADISYIEIARQKGLVAEAIPLARLHPVVAVPKGNPKKIKSIADLERDGVKLALANPDQAAVGKMTREYLREIGEWTRIEKKTTVFKPTVNDIANDVKIGTVDAAIIWDAVAHLYPELETVVIAGLSQRSREVVISLTRTAREPARALQFCRYLGAPEKGLATLRKWGYETVAGDTWAEKPQIVLFSGGVNRPAVEETLKQFEEREGVTLIREYNGCGILVANMKAGKVPDAYFACDRSFLPPVHDLFLDELDVSETDMVIIVPKGNPKKIGGLKDLGTAGLRVGVTNPEQSALGALTVRLLGEVGLREKIDANTKTRVPTADLLVNQLRAGALDAAIVYEANTALVRHAVDIVRIESEYAHAVQPYAIARHSPHKRVMERLLDTIRSTSSREKFESRGFRWRAGDAAP